MTHSKDTPTCAYCGRPFMPTRKHRRLTQRYCSSRCTNGPARDAAEARFWSRVDRSAECWLWLGPTAGSNRYGQLRFRGRTIRAHRLAWELTNEPITEGMSVCHRCDQPLCVNPNHLFLGSHAENMHDMAAKGRATKRRGADVHGARLDESAVRAIRALNAVGVSQRELARQFGVSQHAVWGVVHRKTWQHV